MCSIILQSYVKAVWSVFVCFVCVFFFTLKISLGSKLPRQLLLSLWFPNSNLLYLHDHSYISTEHMLLRAIQNVTTNGLHITTPYTTLYSSPHALQCYTTIKWKTETLQKIIKKIFYWNYTYNIYWYNNNDTEYDT